MAKTLQLRRGTTAEVGAITSAAGELLVDTDKKTVTVGDGSTAGGTPLATDVRVSSAFNAANAASGFAGSAYGQANAATNSAQASYNQANAATNSAQSAYNQANTATSGLSSKQTTLVSGTNIKTINGNSLLGSGDLSISGGGGGSSAANTLAVAATSDNFISLTGGLTTVEYKPTTTDVSISGGIVLNTGNTTSFNTNSNNYVDVVPFGYNQFNGTTYSLSANEPVQGVVFSRFEQLPTKFTNELKSLKPGSKVTFKFVAGANNAVMDTFTIPLIVAKDPMDWVEHVQIGVPNYYGDKANNAGSGYNFSYSSSSCNLKGTAVWFKSPIIQPAYSNSPNATNTTLIGERWGRPIHQNYIVNHSDGHGHLRFETCLDTGRVDTSYAQGAKIGVYEIIFEKPSGTVVTLSEPEFKNVMMYANTIAMNDKLNLINTPVQAFDYANNKILVSRNDITSSISIGSSTLQSYKASKLPSLDLGTTKFYTDPVNNKLVSDVNLAKGGSVKILGTVSGNSTTSNVWTIPSTYTNKYITTSTFKGYYADSKLTNGIYYNQTNYTTPGSLTIINMTDDVYNVLKANGSYVYLNYRKSGVKQNLICQVVNQGSNSIFLAGYTGSSWSQNRPWVKLSCVGYINGSVVSSNTSVSNPTWDYEIGEMTLKIPTEVVTIQTDLPTINLISQYVNSNPTNPGLNISSAANSNPILYINGISANVNGVDVANSTIITNLPKSIYGNTVFVDTAISTITTPSNYATIADVSAQLPTWIPVVDSFSNKTSTSYYVGGGANGIAVYQWNMNTMVGGSADNSLTSTLWFRRDSTLGRKFAHYYDRSLATGQRASQSGPQTASLYAYTATVPGSIWTGEGLYSNTAIGSKDLVYTSNVVSETLTVSKKLVVTSNATSQLDPYADKTIVLLSGYPQAGVDADTQIYVALNHANTGPELFTPAGYGGNWSAIADFTSISFTGTSKGTTWPIMAFGSPSTRFQRYFDQDLYWHAPIDMKLTNPSSNTVYEGTFTVGGYTSSSYLEVIAFTPKPGTTNDPIADNADFTSTATSDYVRSTKLDGGELFNTSGYGTVRSNRKEVPPGAPSYARSVLIGRSSYFPNENLFSGYASIPNKTAFNFMDETKSWTIESWVNCTNENNSFWLMAGAGQSNASQNGLFEFKFDFPFYGYARTYNGNNNMINENCAVEQYNQQADATGGGNNNYFPNAHEWYHVALCYDSMAYKLYAYVNGRIFGMYDLANNGYKFLGWDTVGNLGNYPFGVYSQSGGMFLYNYRVTAGVARYKPTNPYATWYSGLQPGDKIFDTNNLLMPFSTDKDKITLGYTNYDALDLHGGIKLQNITLTSSGNTANANVANSNGSNSSVSTIPINTQGGYLYVSEGSLYYKGSNGTSTLIATA